MALILPNDVANQTVADGDKLQQNFLAIETWGNSETVVRDGSTAMTGPLLLPGPPTQPNQAATKEYADSSGAFIGEMRMYGADTAPNASWLLCQGQAISRTTYATLFGLVGVRFGAGDSTTTFNLPDMRGMVPAGTYSGGNYGATTGTRYGTSESVIVAHNHAGPAHTHDLGGHTHSGTTSGQSANHYHLDGGGGATLLGAVDTGNGFYGGFAGGIAPLYYTGTGAASNDHVHTFGTSGPSTASGSAGTGATSTTGGSGGNANLPPSVAVQFIMKVQ